MYYSGGETDNVEDACGGQTAHGKLTLLLIFVLKTDLLGGGGKKNRPFVPINFASKLDFCISLPGFTQF